MERLRGNGSLSAALAGITAAVVGVIANLGVYFAVHTLFSGSREVDRGPLHLELPDLSTLRLVPLVVAVAAVLLFRVKWSVLRTLGVCPVPGLAAGLAGLSVTWRAPASTGRQRPACPVRGWGRLAVIRASPQCREVWMLPNQQILYGVGLTALFEVVLTVAVPRWRRPALTLTTTAIAVLAVLGWQYVLRATHASQFFTDLPFRPFPISWQDTGSGVVTLAFAGLALAYGPMRRGPAPAVATLALAAGLVALLVDVYLY
jgi:hypothetical protein